MSFNKLLKDIDRNYDNYSAIQLQNIVDSTQSDSLRQKFIDVIRFHEAGGYKNCFFVYRNIINFLRKSCEGLLLFVENGKLIVENENCKIFYQISIDADNGKYRIHPFKNAIIRVSDATYRGKPIDKRFNTEIRKYKFTKGFTNSNLVVGRPVRNTFTYIGCGDYDFLYDKKTLEIGLQLMNYYTKDNFSFAYDLNNNLILRNHFMEILIKGY